MNNNKRPTQNTDRRRAPANQPISRRYDERQTHGQIRGRGIPGKQPVHCKNGKNGSTGSPGGIIIAIEAILLLLAVAAGLLLFSIFRLSFRIEYRTAPPPSLSERGIGADPSLGISESELPVKVEPIDLPLYDWTQPVPESAEHPLDSFSDTVFIGDSRMAGLILYTKLAPINYTATGININQILSSAFIKETDEEGKSVKRTCLEALELHRDSYRAIYISVGTNELGWDVKRFVKVLREFIIDIRKITDVPIYLQLVLPVTAEYAETSQFGISNENADKFNAELLKLTEELELFTLDPRGLFALEDGTLDPARTYDGAHLQVEACRQLAAYYQTHVVNVNAYQNTLPEADE